MDIKNLTILGTSHISKESISKVKSIINDEKPDFVCLELDRKRFYSLMQGKDRISLKLIRNIGIKGFIFMVIASWAEKKLGKVVGTTPGDEMKAAINEAKKNKLKLAFIDQDIEITLRKLSKGITWKEKWRFFLDIITAPFRKKKIVFDLNKVPSKEIIKKLIKEVKSKYPNVYRILVEERNRVIARNMAKLMKQNPDKKFFLIIGAGHEEEVIDMLKNKFE